MMFKTFMIVLVVLASRVQQSKGGVCSCMESDAASHCASHGKCLVDCSSTCSDAYTNSRMQCISELACVSTPIAAEPAQVKPGGVCSCLDPNAPTCGPHGKCLVDCSSTCSDEYTNSRGQCISELACVSTPIAAEPPQVKPGGVCSCLDNNFAYGSCASYGECRVDCSTCSDEVTNSHMQCISKLACVSIPITEELPQVKPGGVCSCSDPNAASGSCASYRKCFVDCSTCSDEVTNRFMWCISELACVGRGDITGELPQVIPGSGICSCSDPNAASHCASQGKCLQ